MLIRRVRSAMTLPGLQRHSRHAGELSGACKASTATDDHWLEPCVLLGTETGPPNHRELVRWTRGYHLMDILRRQLKRIVDDRLREMYGHFVGQALPPEIGQLLEGAGPYALFESSRPSEQPRDAE
jgi:hypothetical protein